MAEEGVYRCEAENRFGKAKTQATAHVESAFITRFHDLRPRG